MFDQPDDALKVIGCTPGGNVLQGLLLLILFGELGEVQEEGIHFLDGEEALGGCSRSRAISSGLQLKMRLKSFTICLSFKL